MAQFVAVGIYSYVLGAFMNPMLEELSWARSDFSLTRSISQIVMAFVGILIGAKVDQIGARPIMLVGTTILVVSLCAHTFVTSLWMWWVLNGIVVTIGCAMVGNLVVNATLSKWFFEKRGRAVAIAAMGVSFGGIAITPPITYLIDLLGWRLSWVLLGLSAGILLYPVAMMMRKAPEDFGLLPDGKKPNSEGSGSVDAAQSEFLNSYSRSEAIRTFSFYGLVLAFGCFAVNIVVVLLLSEDYLADSGFGRGIGAWAIAIASVPAMLSKPLWGILIDKHPAKPLAALSASATGFSLALIVFAALSEDLVLVYIGYVFLGLGWGGMLPMQEVIWASFFGRRYIGSIRGAAMPFSLALGAPIPWLVSYYRDFTGGYHEAFFAVAALNILSGLMIFFVPKPRRSI